MLKKLCFVLALCMLNTSVLGCTIKKSYAPASERNGIAFFGDSITYGGRWKESFSNYSVYELGVPGNTVVDLIDRVRQVYECFPQKVFVMVGINDLLQNESAEIVIQRWRALLEALTGYEVYVQSILPIEDYPGLSIDTIRTVNEGLKSLSEEFGATYIDVFIHMCDSDGYIKPEYTVDGLHLSNYAYDIWVELLSKYIN